MPQITIDLSDAAYQRLSGMAADYNAEQGTQLTTEEWVHLTLREIAISRLLAVKMQEVERDHNDQLRPKIDAERRRLLGQV